MLSGVSYPREGIPDWLFNLGQIFPSSHGVNAFIRIQSMGASLSRSAARNQDALHSGPRIRRSGLHRHRLGAQPRVTRTTSRRRTPPNRKSDGGAQASAGTAPSGSAKSRTAIGPAHRHKQRSWQQASGMTTKTSGAMPDVFFVRTAPVTAEPWKIPGGRPRPDRRVPCGGVPTAQPRRRSRRCSSNPSSAEAAQVVRCHWHDVITADHAAVAFRVPSRTRRAGESLVAVEAGRSRRT